MTTSSALGLVGAVAAGLLFPGVGWAASAGFLIGSLIGSLIDPPKSEGPRLQDLKLQVSSWGKMIPYVWGTGRIAGNIIDQTDLQEHKEVSGGKGGPEVTTYTYSASFDILLCVGPILGVKRIWADARLIWSDTTGEPMPCTLYLGDADQDPDPTFEAIHGVGMVPGYNGYAHAVFTDQPLADFYNRIPQYEFEVYTNVGTFPWRVSSFTYGPGVATADKVGVTYTAGVVSIHAYDDTFSKYYLNTYDIYGSALESDVFDLNPPTGSALLTVRNLDVSANSIGWYQRENFVTSFLGFNPQGVGGASVYQNDFIYSFCGAGGGDWALARWAAPNGVLGVESGTQDSYYSFGAGDPDRSTYVLGTSNVDGFVYSAQATDQLIHEYDAELNAIIRSWDYSAEYLISPIINGGTFVVYQDSVGRLVLCCNRGVGTKEDAAFYLNDNLTLTYIGAVNQATSAVAVIELGTSSYALDAEGIISLVPPTAPELLSTIVAGISDLTPLDVTEYNVTELTDEVRWFALANVMTAKNAISTLRPAFFFDARESNDVVEFKKRGAAPIFSIPDSSLCGRSYGEESGDPLRTIRTKEQGLPRTVTMTYYDVDADYLTGAQSSPRIVTLSEQDVVLDMPIGFTASEALQKCESIQAAEWIRRERFEWSCTRGAPVELLAGGIVPACALEPCDVGIVRGREIYIETRNESPGGVIKFTGVLNAPSIYTQSATSGTGGFVPQTEQGPSVQTELVLLDIPILSQHDAPFGFYAAMGPASDGRWTGATLYKSLDGGVTYSPIASTVSPAIIGQAATVPGSPTVDGVLASYGGGDVVDESELGIRLTDDAAELDSITATALTNGGNYSALSRGQSGSPGTLQWELLQFRDANNVDIKREVLQGFLRGRKNTATSGHADGDKFVLLSTVINVDAPESDLNRLLKYKAVTFGTTLASTPSQDFINTGLSADEFFDTEVEHLPPFQGDSGSPGGGNPGLVPAPGDGDCAAGKFLSACGTWEVPSGTAPTQVKVIQAACSNQTTTLVAGLSKVTFRVPVAMTITSITASLKTADTGSPSVITLIDINKNGSTIFSTRLSIDSGERTSVTAATPYVLTTTALAADDEIAIDIDQVGNAVGLVVAIIGT